MDTFESAPCFSWYHGPSKQRLALHCTKYSQISGAQFCNLVPVSLKVPATLKGETTARKTLHDCCNRPCKVYSGISTLSILSSVCLCCVAVSLFWTDAAILEFNFMLLYRIRIVQQTPLAQLWLAKIILGQLVALGGTGALSLFTTVLTPYLPLVLNYTCSFNLAVTAPILNK